jgi:oligopeptide/dipeptide ABC transporter ATP-binding protein
MNALLRVKDLCKDFPAGGPWRKSTRALDGVDLRVGAGEIWGIAGESGSGKTTLARCTVKLMEPSSGSVFFDGQDLAALQGAELRRKRREFQMVFQDPYASLNPRLTVAEIVAEPLEVHEEGTPRERAFRVRELLAAVALDESLLKKKPPELSGGQQQRVGIARGIALRPRLLVADEPVSALDVSVQAQVLNLLADLKKSRDLTLILISHSLYAIRYLCAHISVMYRGRIIEEAACEEFFSHPRHPYSQALLAAMPVLDPIRGRIIPLPKADAELESGRARGCGYRDRCPRRFSRCAEQVPPLAEIAPGQKAACFLYQ